MFKKLFDSLKIVSVINISAMFANDSANYRRILIIRSSTTGWTALAKIFSIIKTFFLQFFRNKKKLQGEGSRLYGMEDWFPVTCEDIQYAVQHVIVKRSAQIWKQPIRECANWGRFVLCFRSVVCRLWVFRGRIILFQFSSLH